MHFLSKHSTAPNRLALPKGTLPNPGYWTTVEIPNVRIEHTNESVTFSFGSDPARDEMEIHYVELVKDEIQPTTASSQYFQPNIVSYADYYPFGSTIHDRTWTSESYRYGFNTQEKTDEIAGAGNHTTAMYWEYDTRLGRRWNQDPKPNSSISNYACFAGNPINVTDFLGDTTTFKNKDGLTKSVNDGFANRTIDVSDALYKKIEAGRFENPVSHFRYGHGNQGHKVEYTDKEYLGLLFEVVSVGIAKNDDLKFLNR